jgi:hypothetical protein
MDRPSTDAAAIAAATMAASLCQQLIGVTIDRTDGIGMHAAYISAYREFFSELASIEPFPAPNYGEVD